MPHIPSLTSRIGGKLSKNKTLINRSSWSYPSKILISLESKEKPWSHLRFEILHLLPESDQNKKKERKKRANNNWRLKCTIASRLTARDRAGKKPPTSCSPRTRCASSTPLSLSIRVSRTVAVESAFFVTGRLRLTRGVLEESRGVAS